ncbi:hypothetical protein NDU88_005409 [Pleurodeles waltl]|uniref:Uncharacterized protein n=1 Tax=Pleurodeles waltl TaxID=8319 RepID=A0AAV7LS24_PLEWA|nr:hypothetical protein NDU88_005409 [Pleurodeles waltl]
MGRIHIKLQEFQELARTEIQHVGKYATARVYGEGDRPGRVLANLLRPHRNSNAITKVVAADGSELDDPALIAQRFRDYYQDLYTSRVTSTPEAVLDYLTHIALP